MTASASCHCDLTGETEVRELLTRRLAGGLDVGAVLAIGLHAFAADHQACARSALRERDANLTALNAV